ncbi:hypothetical protein BC941DRAFT_465046 [Chlamydoabsidia padenii]|nr:hypothetical protein BC941DRAFT_465046 [Chlamydoabsidia padenii]
MNQRHEQKRSPRQIASKAYSLATKKINGDDRRKRRIYHMRERLLIQNTMSSAKTLLNNSNQSPMRVLLSDPYDYIQTSLSRTLHYPPPPPLPTATLSDPAVVLTQDVPSLHILLGAIHQWSLFDLLSSIHTLVPSP